MLLNSVISITSIGKVTLDMNRSFLCNICKLWNETSR